MLVAITPFELWLWRLPLRSMCEFNRTQPGGCIALVPCVLYLTQHTVNLLLFTGGLGLIKSWCACIHMEQSEIHQGLSARCEQEKINIH